MKAPAISIIGLTLFLSGYAVAQQGSIDIETEAFKEVEVAREDGTTEYKTVEPGKVLPNDEIFYVTTFRNAGGEPATDIVITNPVPNNSVYKGGSAFGSGTEITFSVDGGETYAPAGELQLVNDQGERVPADGRDITHIRWIYTRALEPGEESTVTFRTIIGKSADTRGE